MSTVLPSRTKSENILDISYYFTTFTIYNSYQTPVPRSLWLLVGIPEQQASETTRQLVILGIMWWPCVRSPSPRDKYLSQQLDHLALAMQCGHSVTSLRLQWLVQGSQSEDTWVWWLHSTQWTQFSIQWLHHLSIRALGIGRAGQK